MPEEHFSKVIVLEGTSRGRRGRPPVAMKINLDLGNVAPPNQGRG
jgi:hypothetical protein